MNKRGLEWLNTPTADILINLPSFIEYLYDLDDFEDYDEANILTDLLLTIPAGSLISAMIDAMRKDSHRYPYGNLTCFPDAWFKLALNPDSRQVMVSQLSALDFGEYIFSFLNGIDEGDDTPGEMAIRGVLDELHYPIPRDTSNDWSPGGKYKRVTRRKIIELKTDPIANFTGLINTILYYDSTYWDYFLQSVTNAIDCISDENLLVALMINDLASRGDVDASLFEYASCWIRLTNAPECAKEIEKQLMHLPGDSCVIPYLNAMFLARLDYDQDMSLLVSLKGILERANVFVDCALEKSSDE